MGVISVSIAKIIVCTLIPSHAHIHVKSIFTGIMPFNLNRFLAFFMWLWLMIAVFSIFGISFGYRLLFGPFYNLSKT